MNGSDVTVHSDYFEATYIEIIETPRVPNLDDEAQ